MSSNQEVIQERERTYDHGGPVREVVVRVRSLKTYRTDQNLFKQDVGTNTYRVHNQDDVDFARFHDEWLDGDGLSIFASIDESEDGLVAVDVGLGRNTEERVGKRAGVELDVGGLVERRREGLDDLANGRRAIQLL